MSAIRSSRAWVVVAVVALALAAVLALRLAPRGRAVQAGGPERQASCQASGLRIGAGSMAAQGEERLATLPITNVSGRSCRMFGYPALSIYEADGQQDAVSVNHTGPTPRAFTLAPGARASVTISWTQVPTTASTACSLGAQLLLTPRGSRQAMVASGVAGAVEICQGVTFGETALVPAS